MRQGGSDAKAGGIIRTAFVQNIEYQRRILTLIRRNLFNFIYSNGGSRR